VGKSGTKYLPVPAKAGRAHRTLPGCWLTVHETIPARPHWLFVSFHRGALAAAGGLAHAFAAGCRFCAKAIPCRQGRRVASARLFHLQRKKNGLCQNVQPADRI
jgi:hypothetical protein